MSESEARNTASYQSGIGDGAESNRPSGAESTSSAGTASTTIRRILVPLDLNRLSEAKMPAAETQARGFGAELILLHIIPSLPPTDEAVTVAESQALTYLQAIATRLRSEGIETQFVLRFGPIAQTILDEVASQSIDLIVLGANVRRGFSRLLLGSVAEDIIARSPCPVLVVRPNVADAERVQPVRNFADDVARIGPVAPRELGMRTVDIARIVGSVGRASELDANFRVQSRQRSELQRFNRVLKAMENGDPIPPIVLYKLGYGYYVLDGNHRVAAARQLEMGEIEAEVTEFVALGDARSQRIFAERRAFERTTGLRRIGLAVPGYYPRIEEMIREYAASHDYQQDDLREASRRWESEVFYPASRRIRGLRLSQYFNDHRTADIFVDLARFRDELSEREERSFSWDEAVESFRLSLGQGQHIRGDN